MNFFYRRGICISQPINVTANMESLITSQNIVKELNGHKLQVHYNQITAMHQLNLDHLSVSSDTFQINKDGTLDILGRNIAKVHNFIAV